MLQVQSDRPLVSNIRNMQETQYTLIIGPTNAEDVAADAQEAEAMVEDTRNLIIFVC